MEKTGQLILFFFQEFALAFSHQNERTFYGSEKNAIERLLKLLFKPEIWLDLVSLCNVVKI